jgi:hypothetical protein
MHASALPASSAAKALKSETGVCAHAEAKKVREAMWPAHFSRRSKAANKNFKACDPKAIEPSARREEETVIYF